jgi:chemotaxis signal transduction protein
LPSLFKMESAAGAINDDPSLNAPEQGKKYLIFKVGPYPLALELEVLKRVHDAEGVPPRTPGSRVLDLYHLTGAKSERTTHYWIEMDFGAGRFLMPVEEVEGIRELSLAIPIPYPAILRREETGYIRSLLFDGLHMITVLDPEALAEGAGGGRLMKGRAKKTGPAGPVAVLAGEGTQDVNSLGAAPAAGKDVIFESGGYRFILDLAMVVQIMNRDEIFPVPSQGLKVRGVVYFMDYAVPVVDPGVLRELLGVKDRGRDEFSMIVLAETGRGLLGLGCQRIVKVKAREAGRAAAAPGSVPDREGEPVLIKLNPAEAASKLFLGAGAESAGTERAEPGVTMEAGPCRNEEAGPRGPGDG